MSPADSTKAKRALELELDAFALSALEHEADELGVPIEDLASFAVMYYLADRDSDRIARELPDALRATSRAKLAGTPGD